MQKPIINGLKLLKNVVSLHIALIKGVSLAAYFLFSRGNMISFGDLPQLSLEDNTLATPIVRVTELLSLPRKWIKFEGEPENSYLVLPSWFLMKKMPGRGRLFEIGIPLVSMRLLYIMIWGFVVI